MSEAKTPQHRVTPQGEHEEPELWISPYSRYIDDVWVLDGVGKNVPPNRARIDFGMSLAGSDGSEARLTDPAWRPLLDEVKAFLWSLRADPPEAGFPVKDITLIAKAARLRVVLQWMATNGVSSFDFLDEQRAERFVAHLRATHRGKGGKAITPMTLSAYTTVVKQLFLQAEKVGAGPRADPFPGETGGERAGAVRSTLGAWPPTPDEVAKPLILGAIRLIHTPADDVIALRDAAQAARDSATESHWARYLAAREPLGSWEFSVPEGESEPWHLPITRLQQLADLEARIVDAAYVVIAYLCGPRCSEIIDLRSGCVEQGTHVTDDGLESIAYIVGDIRKTNQAGHRWVAPPEAVRAVEVMERVSAPLRERSGRDELFLRTNAKGLIGPYATIAPIDNASMNDRLNRLRDFLDLPYHQGQPWRLSTHQGRKTFARFISRKDKTGLYALQAQLGHVTRAMTDRGYAGTDTELLEEIIQENRQETEDLLAHLFSQDSLGGDAGKRIEAHNPFIGRTKDPEAIREYVHGVLADTELNIAPCDWGLCLYRPEAARCGGDETGPNRIQANPSLCSGCPNFVLSAQHRPYWSNRRDEAERILADPRTDEINAEFCRLRIQESEMMLAQIDSQEE